VCYSSIVAIVDFSSSISWKSAIVRSENTRVGLVFILVKHSPISVVTHFDKAYKLKLQS
jgi:hypothetical protein